MTVAAPGAFPPRTAADAGMAGRLTLGPAAGGHTVNVTQVFVQKKAGEFVSANSFAAWRGFTDRGFDAQFYEWPDREGGRVAVRPSTLVVGGAGAVRHALARLGVATPAVDDLPEPLAAFRGRRVWQTTWGDVCRGCDDDGPPVFVKPLRDPKAFPARLIAAFRDLIPLAHLPADVPVLASDPVEFVSEWRFFVVGGRVVGTGWYHGHPLVFPDPAVVGEAVRAWGADAPAGYGIDFGVVAGGATRLVEVNDGYSLGCLGLRPRVYAELLEARWVQLVSRTVAVAEPAGVAEGGGV